MKRSQDKAKKKFDTRRYFGTRKYKKIFWYKKKFDTRRYFGTRSVKTKKLI